MSKTLTMTQGNPLRLLVVFSLPLMFGNVFQQLYAVVDTAIVGRGVGIDALAALGSVDWLNWMMLGIATGFTQGFSVRVAQKFGENNPKDLQLYMGQSALAAVVLAALCLLLGQLALPVFCISCACLRLCILWRSSTPAFFSGRSPWCSCTIMPPQCSAP